MLQTLKSKVALSFLLFSVAAIIIVFTTKVGFPTNVLTISVVVFCFIGALIVFHSDPYRKDYESGTQIYHPRTHATLTLLALIISAVAMICFALPTKAITPPFILTAFFIGTIGGAMGVLQRLDFVSVESQLLFENMQFIQNKVDDANKTKTDDDSESVSKTKLSTETQELGEVGYRFDPKLSADTTVKKLYASVTPRNALSLHTRIVFQCYRSVAVAGVFAVFGLIVLTSFGQSFEIATFDSDQIETVCEESSATDSAKKTCEQVCKTLKCWLDLRPNNYGFALFVCILFGYSQRLWSGVLNRAEELSLEYVDIHSQIPASSN